MDETPFRFHSAAITAGTAEPSAELPAGLDLDCMKLLDGSFGFVVSYRVPAGSAREIFAHARASLALYHSRGDSRTLPRLFGPAPFLGGKYDVALRLRLADLRRNALYRDDPAGANFPRYVLAQRDVERWARRGLGSRALWLRSQFWAGAWWRVGEAAPVPAGMLLLFDCNPENISRLADRGPAAKSPEVETWKQLWGDRSELRRFKDGSIVYTNRKIGAFSGI